MFKTIGSTENRLIGYSRDGSPMVQAFGEMSEFVRDIDDFDGWHVVTESDGERVWIDPRGDDRRF